MLDREKAIDAVVVSTPDHSHAVITMAAIKRGKHVYCEKPLTHTVEEARKVALAAREAKVATQMGNQGHSGDGIRQTCEWIWDNAIGNVREVHGWSHTGGDWSSGFTARPKETPPVPAILDWDLWLGPMPQRPYHPAYVPYNWRGWWEFGTGAIGDMACHNLDPAFWALKLGHPTRVDASSSPLNSETAPLASIMRYEFPARGDMPAVKMTWYAGGLMPPCPDGYGSEKSWRQQGNGNGILFIGDKGSIVCDGWGGAPTLIPETRMKSYTAPVSTLPRVANHHRDWLDACKGGPTACSNFDYAGPMTEVVLLGNVALRAGKQLEWDGEKMKATNAPEADEYVRCNYRKGWAL
jgi:predicted dehydrogenase